MFLKKLSIISGLILISLFSGAYFAFANTTGFTTDMVEISSTSIVEGEEVELLVRFANHEDKTLSGKINFYDGDLLLGSRELNLEGGQSGEYIITWKASLGEHSFVAKAENLKLAGTNVTILGQSTQAKEIMIGFKNSGVAEKLRNQGGFGAIVAGVMNEVREFFVPIVQSLDNWRDSKIAPLEETKERITNQKQEASEKIRPILVVHGIVVSILLFIVTKKAVFFSLVVILLIWILSRLVRLFRRIVQKDYRDE